MQDYLKSVEQLYRLTDKLGRAQALSEVCETAIESIVDAIGIERVSILVFDADNVMRFKAWRGLSAAYRAAVDGHSPWTADAKSPVPILAEDVLTDPSVSALRDVISSEGIRSLAFIPITYDSRLLGKFML